MVSAAYYLAMGGAWTEARARCDIAMDLARQSGSPSFLAFALGALGYVLAETDPDAAIPALEESIALAHAGATDNVLGPSLGELSRLHAKNGNIAKALDVLCSAVVYTRDTGDHLTTMAGVTRAVEILAAAGRDEGAVVISSAVTQSHLRSQMLALVEEQKPLIEDLRSRLGEDRYDTARAKGAALAYDDLVRYTLGEIDAALAEDDG